jgi:RNA polymerase sigma-70 factor (ECF subfamily)
MQRDTEEFIELLTGAQSPVFGYIMSLCHDHTRAQDILQETNLTIWRKAEDYEAGTNFTAWACRIAYFHVLNHRRKHSREQLVFDEEVFDYLAERQERRSEDADARLRALRRCVAELPPKQRELIDRRYEPGASVKAIADEDGSTEGAISQALFRIRAALQKCVERRVAAEASGIRIGG